MTDAPPRTGSPVPTVHGRWVFHCTPDWPQFVGAGWLDRIMSEPVTDRFHAKQGRSVGRWTLLDGDRKLVVYLKRHYDLPRLHGYLARLFPHRSWSPALQEWDHLKWAERIGLVIPRAVAVGEFRGPKGKLQSFLALEELPGMQPLYEIVPLAFERLSPAEFARWKHGLIAEVARLSRELHRRHTFHQDLYLSHFYVRTDDTLTVPESWFGRVATIDFHRLARHTLLGRWWQLKDLGQLLYSTFRVPGITPRDRMRFWKEYRGGDWSGSNMPPRWLAKLARWKAARYDEHNEKKRAKVAG